MSPIRTCPPPLLFQTLLDGMLSVEDELQLKSHLDVCVPCQQVLERLSLTLREEFQLRRPAPLDDDLRRAMHALKVSPPGYLDTVDWHGEEEAAVADTPEPSFEGWLGPYEIKEVIGRGGMGVVLKAFDPSLHRLVALKVLAPHLASSITARKRFAREGRAAAAVRHEHVVAVHGVHEADGLPYLVMEYVPGISLQDRLDRDGPLDVPAILRIGMQTAAGLAAAHAQGLIHRDIKPANILLENGDEHVKITDFGLARAVDDVGLTQSNVLTGTPLYMSPEQARGETVDPRSDLFSLGSVLYAACTGRPPFRAPSAVVVLHRICSDEPTPIAELNADIPDWLCSFIAVLLAKDRAERFSSAAEAARVLGQYLTHLEQPARQPHPPRLARWRGPRRSRRRGLLLLAVALILAGIFAASFFRVARAPDPAPAPSHARISSRPSLRVLLEHPKPVLCAVFSPDARSLATACQDHAVRIWDWNTGQLLRELIGHHKCVWSVAFSPDGRTLASCSGEWFPASQSGQLCLWDVTTGQMRRSLSGPASTIFSVVFSPDGHTLASGGWDRMVRLWDPETGEQRAVLSGHKAIIRFLAFSRDGRTLASADFDGCIKLWDVVTRACLATLSDPHYRINALAFSPDGKRLAAAENPNIEPPEARIGRVKLWDLDTHQEVRVLGEHKGMILCVAFAPDGKTLVSGGGDWDHFGEVFLWDTTTWANPIRLPDYRAWVEGVVFSPDGRLLVSSGGALSSRGEVKLWSWPNAAPLGAPGS
jgi:serine/threonine protein kinase